MNVVIIGSGNVATQLGISLLTNNVNIVQVYSRSKESAEILACKLRCDFTDDIKLIKPNADIYLLCIKDDAIASFSKLFHNLNEGIIAHTSGAQSLNILSKYSNHGVFYPLQTISKTKRISFRFIPICIEGNNLYTSKKLEILADIISKKVYKVSSKQRVAIHTAAVFANNFSNHLYSLASDLLKSERISPQILQKLIAETGDKAKKTLEKNLSLNTIQTGPAKRGDKKTMAIHLDYLNSQPKKYTDLYTLFSKSIEETNDKL
jgi:predicted short-subunit dehydrogenase-like oxidoreductase (DUF2520 family)